MTLNTSAERVDWLIQRSDEIYDEIDQVYDGEIRYNRMLRLGINTLGIALREGHNLSEVGAMLRDMPLNNPDVKGPLDALAHDYGKQIRGTLDRQHQPETDARHAIHLMRLSPEYAAIIDPTLDANKVAGYGLGHDLVEARAGDTVTVNLTEKAKAEKDLREAKGLAALRAEFYASYPELIEYIEAYEALEEPEAEFTKSNDKFEPSFTHLHNQGFQLVNVHGIKTAEQLLADTARSTARMMPYASKFPLLMEDRAELIRRVIEATYPKAA